MNCNICGHRAEYQDDKNGEVICAPCLGPFPANHYSLIDEPEEEWDEEFNV
jgi:hypothetical protein